MLTLEKIFLRNQNHFQKPLSLLIWDPDGLNLGKKSNKSRGTAVSFTYFRHFFFFNKKSIYFLAIFFVFSTVTNINDV